MKTYQCSRCANTFEEPRPQARAPGALSTKRIGLEEFIHIVRPKCGNHDFASERKLFGMLGPRGRQALVFAIMLGVLAVAILRAMP